MRCERILPGNIIAVLSLCLFLAGCSGKTGTPCSATEITDYFVNPSSAVLRSLALRSCDTAQCNTAFHTARSKAAAGTSQEWLTDSSGMPYLVGFSTPQVIGADTTYPLIIYLHGGIGGERNDKGDSAFFMLKPLADTFNLFLASPSANRYAPWWSAIGLSRILQTLRFMTLHYPINPRKVFLAGVSDGATGCYAAANTISAPFAGFIAVSGFGGMLPKLGMPLAPANLKQRPIYNVNAGLDHIYPVENVKEFIRRLQEEGVPVTSNIYPDEKHGFNYRGKEMGTLAGIIRTWSRPAAEGVSWTFIPGCPNCPDNLFAWTLSSDNASIHAFWRHDTLVVREQGLQSMTAVFPALPSIKKIFVKTLANGGKIHTCRPLSIGWPQNLELMKYRCFPGITGAAAFCTVKF
jgi:hypothetical protein